MGEGEGRGGEGRGERVGRLIMQTQIGQSLGIGELGGLHILLGLL